MENQHDKLIEEIDAKRPSLSSEDKAVLWSAIASKTFQKEAFPSPYTWFVVFKKPITALTFGLLLMVSTTGLVAASEPSRPGDTLFAVKQATESIRLALASDDAKTRLEAEFAAERLLELSSILEESLADYRNTQATTSLNSDDEKRVNEALNVTLSYFGKANLSSTTKDNLYTELASLLEGSPIRIDDERLKSYKDDTEIEIREDEDERRIEIEEGEDRIRIREKDGEIRIDYKDDSDDDDEYKETKSNDDDAIDSISSFEAEANVFSDRTIVEVEINDQKSRFETSATTKAAVVREIVGRYGIDQATVEARLDFEIEDDSHNEDKSEEEDTSRTKAEDDSSEDNNQDNDSSDDSDDSEVRIEVRVEDGEAEVKVDGQNDGEFTLPYTTRSVLITAIALRTGLSEAIVSSNLDLEIKD